MGKTASNNRTREGLPRTAERLYLCIILLRPLSPELSPLVRTISTSKACTKLVYYLDVDDLACVDTGE